MTAIADAVNAAKGSGVAIIADGGSGFDLEAATLAPRVGRQLGLRGMEERAALAAGGRLDIETTMGRGMTIYSHDPLPTDEGDGGEMADG